MGNHDVLWLPTLYSQLHLSTPKYSLGPDPLQYDCYLSLSDTPPQSYCVTYYALMHT